MAVERRITTGFTLIETLVVLTIGMVLTGMAIPQTINAMRSYQLSAAVSAATGAVQSTRYLAIMHGYPYQIAFTPATHSYQVFSEPSGQTTYSAVGPAIPISGSGEICISGIVTFQFAPGGTVTETSNPANMVFSIGNGYGGSSNITVSGVGNVTVVNTNKPQAPGC